MNQEDKQLWEMMPKRTPDHTLTWTHQWHINSAFKHRKTNKQSRKHFCIDTCSKCNTDTHCRRIEITISCTVTSKPRSHISRADHSHTLWWFSGVTDGLFLSDFCSLPVSDRQAGYEFIWLRHSAVSGSWTLRALTVRQMALSGS